MNSRLIDALMDGVAPVIRDYTEKAVAGLRERLAAVEARPLERGEKGEPGAAGEPGPAGERGPDGAPGLAGEPGREGAAGLPGEPGAAGQPGEPGPPGPQGEAGSAGLTGEPGPQGPAGEAGPAGEPGPAGEAGPEGAAGEPGPAGERGKDGAPGERGEAGERGKDGAPGLNGKDGAPGERGEAGLNGKDHDPALVEALVKAEVEIAMRSVVNQLRMFVTTPEFLALVVGKDGRDGQPGIPGRDGERGKDGADGFGLDDFDVETKDGGREFLFTFRREGVIYKQHKVATEVMLDRNVWRAGTEYRKGDGVSNGGSFFVAQIDNPPGKPETLDCGWRLAIKRGHDGKNGKDGKDGERGPAGPRGLDLTQVNLTGDQKWR